MKWEVRTMRSGTSFFDLTLYRKTLARFWPLWAVSLVVWLFVLPLNGLMILTDYLDGGRTGTSMLRFAQNVGNTATQWGLIFGLLMGLAVAMAVCSTLYNNRSANFMGALPIRREAQFFSTWLAGVTMLTVPNVIVFLLTLLVEIAAGMVVWESLLFWLAMVCGVQFFFFCFALCLGQFTGHILALPVYFGIFNVLVVAVYFLVGWVLESFFFGFNGLSDTAGFITWCTPMMALINVDIDIMEIGGVWMVDIEGLWVVGVYAAAALVLTVCALLLHRRRHLESAGDIVAVRAMRPVFKYGVSFCAGLFLGFLSAELLGLGEGGLMFAILVWGLVGYFVAQMLLDKSIRVFRKWKGAAAMVLVFAALFTMVGFDLLGYESRVPEAEQVASVELNGLDAWPYDSGAYLHNREFTDPEIIADAAALHRRIVELGPEGEEDPENRYSSMHFLVTYHLKNGTSFSRSYGLSMGDSLYALAQRIRDNDTVRMAAYDLDVIDQWRAAGAQLDRVSVFDEQKGDRTESGGSQFLPLWNAVMADFAAGRLGVHDLDLYARGMEYSEKLGYTEPYPETRGYELEFRWKVRRDAVDTSMGYTYYHDENYAYKSVSFIVTEAATQTLAALEELEAAGLLVWPGEGDDYYSTYDSVEDMLAGVAG